MLENIDIEIKKRIKYGFVLVCVYYFFLLLNCVNLEGIFEFIV